MIYAGDCRPGMGDEFFVIWAKKIAGRESGN